jgi:uncharacterized protein YgiM (DUF1202 family)
MYISEDIIGINGKVRLKKGTKVEILKEGKPVLIEDENKERYYISNDLLTNEQPPDQKKHAVPNRKR